MSRATDESNIFREICEPCPHCFYPDIPDDATPEEIKNLGYILPGEKYCKYCTRWLENMKPRPSDRY